MVMRIVKMRVVQVPTRILSTQAYLFVSVEDAENGQLSPFRIAQFGLQGAGIDI